MNVTRDKFHWLFKLKSRSTHKGGNNGHESFSEGKWIREENEIKFNGTIFIVGEIVELILPEEIISKDGYVDIEKAGTIAISGLDNYHEIKRIARLAYAKPVVEPKEL